VNFAARLNGSMSTPQARNRATFEKASEFFNSLLEQQNRSGCWIIPTALSTAAPIAQAVGKGTRSDFLGDRALPITCPPVLATHLI
jgi:hypothetical protein